jgi:hypothetical protein
MGGVPELRSQNDDDRDHLVKFDKPPQSLHQKGGPGANPNSLAFNIRSIKGTAHDNTE